MFVHKNRVLTIYFIFTLAFLALMGRLYQIQFISGPQYSQQAVAQRQKTINYIQFPRGTILDQKFRPMTNVEQQPCVAVFPVMIEDISYTSELLARFLNISPEIIAGKITYNSQSLTETASDSSIVKEPFILKADVSDQEIVLIEKAKLPGVYILPLIPRYQPGWPGVHILGSVGSINEEEYQESSFLGKYYQSNDIIGKSGLEKQYEDYLRGSSTERIAALVDVRGQHLEGSGFTLLSPEKEEEDSLNRVVTTIDRDYQIIAEQALEGHNGAAVVMDVWNGDILAIASSPKYDPYMLEKPTTDDAYVNKALKNYPPASVFKILVAAAALEEGIVKPDDLFTCTGGIAISPERTVSCWNKEGHGEISFTQAGAYSCNPVFVDVGLKLGGENIIKYAEKFGLNDDKIIGYDIPKTQHIHFNPNVLGDIANVSIGENGISLSPVLVAKLVSQVANGGFSITPRLVSRIEDDHGKELEEFINVTGKRVIKAETAASIKAMLEMGVTEGTGKSAQVPGIRTAGKTGSSEINAVWFAGFAPVDVPRWAVVVFIQKGSSGGKEAAPIFQKIISDLAKKEEIL
ncbi:MAG: penicillin-binding transpeptidase domain-containing protein [Dehalobacterium sp.]